MKTSKKLLCCIALWASSAAVQAQFNVFMPEGNIRQDTIGTLQLRVQYETTFRIDTTRLEKKPLEETLILEIGAGVSKFHSYSKYLCDSVYQADIADKASQETINRHLNQYGTSRFTETVSKGFPSGRITTQDAVAGFSRIRYEEELEFPQWKLTEETDTLIGYPCRRAECFYKGRRWTAWFTEEIAVSEGPWKLGGLPGLILKAHDSEEHYRFTAAGIELCRDRRPITLRLRNHELVNRKQYRKIHNRYYADPVGFIQGSQPGVSMTVRDEHGNTVRPKAIPNNPIERE